MFTTYKALCLPGQEDKGTCKPWQRAALAGGSLPTAGIPQPSRAVLTIREPTGTCSGIRPGVASERFQPEYLNRVFKTGL